MYVFAQFMSMILPNCVNIALKDLRSSVGFVSGPEGDRKGKKRRANAINAILSWGGCRVGLATVKTRGE